MLRYIVLPSAALALISLSTVSGSTRLSTPAAQLLSYRLEPKEPLKYRMVADLKGKLPIGDSTEAADITARLSLTYTALPKTRLKDGTGDVDFEVSNVDFEVLGLPFVVPDDQARDILNMTVTLAKSGEVIRVHARDKEMPFSVSVPGVDPKRLYALIFPIVFQKTPVREGDTWGYKSELLGGQGTAPKFTATLLKPDKADGDGAVARLKQQFEMPVNVRKNEEKKPVAADKEAHRKQVGKIDGDGIFKFDREKGRMTRGDVTIRANIKDTLVGEPIDENEPAELSTSIEAKVKIDLLPVNGAASASKSVKREKP